MKSMASSGRTLVARQYAEAVQLENEIVVTPRGLKNLKKPLRGTATHRGFWRLPNNYWRAQLWLVDTKRASLKDYITPTRPDGKCTMELIWWWGSTMWNELIAAPHPHPHMPLLVKAQGWYLEDGSDLSLGVLSWLCLFREYPKKFHRIEVCLRQSRNFTVEGKHCPLFCIFCLHHTRMRPKLHPRKCLMPDRYRGDRPSPIMYENQLAKLRADTLKQFSVSF